MVTIIISPLTELGSFLSVEPGEPSKPVMFDFRAVSFYVQVFNF
jgi:hypothetical protein